MLELSKEKIAMKIRMYECGFGDCFRLREENQVDLYVDFGIHASSWPIYDRIKRFKHIIGDMEKEKDFLLTHYHDDHFNGAIYMAAHTLHRFRDVYISDVWNMPGSVYVTSLTLLRGIFTNSVVFGQNTIIDFLKTICTGRSRIHFISRGVRFQNDQYIALWPEKQYAAKKAQKMFEQLQGELDRENLERIERIANRLNKLVVALANDSNGSIQEYIVQFNELGEEYFAVQRAFDESYGDNYDKIQYKLTKFGNEISIVFQNYQADRNVLFTGDFGKKKNWSFIENNMDTLVKMHSYYEVIKIPHHGTKSYYHSFRKRIDAASTLMIPNGYISRNWYVDSRYNTDSVAVKNRTVCAHNKSCSGPACPQCRCIFPYLHLDV